LGPILYLLCTADIPTTRVTEMATNADETAILASHVDLISVFRNLQIHPVMCRYLFATFKPGSKSADLK
jgi:hypothetical protein